MMSNYLRVTLKLSAAIVAVLIAGHALVLPAAAETSWSDAEPVDDEFVSSWFPEIDADPTGKVRMTWEATRNPTDEGVNEANGSVIVMTELGPEGWSEPAPFQVKDVYNAARPIVASDGRYVHVIARGLIDRSVTGSSIQALAGMYYTRAAANTDLTNYHSWTEPFRLSNGASYWAQLVALEGGELVVVYNELQVGSADDTKASQTHLFSRRSTNNGASWSPPVKISTSTDSVARTSLAVSPIDGTLILAWDEGYDNLTGQGEAAGIQIATSTDGGATWSEPYEIGDGETGSRAARGTVEQSTVATNGELTVLVYRSIEDDILLYRTSSDAGATWSEEEVIPNAVPRSYDTPHHFDRLALVIDAGGSAHLAFVGPNENAPKGLSVVAMSLDDGHWSQPEAVASPDGYPEYPRLAVALGNQLHLTFFVRDELFTEAGRFTIWAASGESDAPAVEPAQVAPPEPIPNTSAGAVATVPELAKLPDIPPQQQPVGVPESESDPRSTLDNPIVSALWFTAIALPIILIVVAGVRRLFQIRF